MFGLFSLFTTLLAQLGIHFIIYTFMDKHESMTMIIVFNIRVRYAHAYYQNAVSIIMQDLRQEATSIKKKQSKNGIIKQKIELKQADKEYYIS